MKRFFVIALLFTSSITAMNFLESLADKAAKGNTILSDEEMQEAQGAILAFTKAIINRDKPTLPNLKVDTAALALVDYLTNETYDANGKKKYDGKVRLYVALELFEKPEYGKYKDRFFEALTNCESLYLLPHLRETDSGTKYLWIESRKPLVRFAQEKKVSANTLATMHFIQSVIDKKYKFMRDLQSHFYHHSIRIDRLKELIDRMGTLSYWANFMAMETQHNLETGYTRLFHDCCNSLVRNMGFLAESYRDEQKKARRLTLSDVDYDNINSIIAELMEQMITKCKVDINLRDLDAENTALHYIIKHADNARKTNVMIKALLEAKADPTLKNIKGKTPLDLCEYDSSKKILQNWIAAHQPAQSQQQQANPTTTTTTTTSN